MKAFFWTIFAIVISIAAIVCVSILFPENLIELISYFKGIFSGNITGNVSYFPVFANILI